MKYWRRSHVQNKSFAKFQRTARNILMTVFFLFKITSLEHETLLQKGCAMDDFLTVTQRCIREPSNPYNGTNLEKSSFKYN